MPESFLNCQHLTNPHSLRLVRRMVSSGPPQPFNIIVDNQEARASIVSYLGSQGYSVLAVQNGNTWNLRATPFGGEPAEKILSSATDTLLSQQRRTAVMFLSDKLGSGDELLGERLMRNFIPALSEFGTNLWRIVLINSGVKLAANNSPVLNYLQEYEKNGTGVLVCKECAYHYGFGRVTPVGTLSDLHEMITSLQMADRVLRL